MLNCNKKVLFLICTPISVLFTSTIFMFLFNTRGASAINIPYLALQPVLKYRSAILSAASSFSSGNFQKVSPMAPTATPPPVQEQQQQQQQAIKLGSFVARFPDIYPAVQHYKIASKSMYKVRLDKRIKNVRNAYRKHAATSIDALMKGLTVPLTKIIASYESGIKGLHPYENAVLHLTLSARAKAGHRSVGAILSDLRELRKRTSAMAKEFAGAANNASTAEEARQLLANSTEVIEQLYREDPHGKALEEMIELQKELRRVPTIDISIPTVVLVGAPNVGKSSIVRAISTGTPEVNNYPFTTRGVTIGHILDKKSGLRIQVMDTPGLLARPASAYNHMEQLTFASMQHLPTKVLFVLDPSDTAGAQSSVAAQLKVREVLKAAFPDRAWIDVVSKIDLIHPSSSSSSSRIYSTDTSSSHDGDIIDKIAANVPFTAILQRKKEGGELHALSAIYKESTDVKECISVSVADERNIALLRERVVSFALQGVELDELLSRESKP